MNNTKHTARYQLSRFLQSEESFKLPLDSADYALLATIFDFMDTGNNEICYVEAEKIYKISRVPQRTAKRHIKKLVDLKIIGKKRTIRQNNYFIGETVTSFIRNIDCEKTAQSAKSAIQSATMALPECHSGTPIYKNKYNNNYKDKISPENQKPAYQDLSQYQTSPTADKPAMLLQEFIRGEIKSG